MEKRQAGEWIYCRAGHTNGAGDGGLPPQFGCWLETSRSEFDTLQAEYLGLVPQELRAEFNDPARYCVEVLHLVGLEFLQKLPQALDETAFLLTAVVVGIAKLQKNLVIWEVEGEESASGGG
jgi:hypothetical protein